MLYYIFWAKPINLEPSASFYFSLFLSFTEKEYQTESKWNKTFAMIFLGPEETKKTWREGHKIPEEATSLKGAP